MKSEIEKLKGNFRIYFNGQYIVLSGTKLYIFKPDGSCAACRKDIRNAGRITFLSDNRMLLCCGKSVLHLINLKDGTDLWTVQFPKTDFNLAHFAVTPEESCAYTFDYRKCQLFLIRVDLNAREIDTYDVSYDIGATRDIICDDEGIPCVLKTVFENIGGKTYSQNGVRIQDYDILYRGSSYYWKSKWQFDGGRHASCFLGSTDRIVTNDLHLYEPSTGAMVNLLEQESEWQIPDASMLECWTDITGRYLCLEYQTGNVLIDMQERRVAAQYAGDCKRGCLVGKEYWIGSDEKLCRKPFPAMEPIIPVKTVGGMEEFYSKHPELW